MNLERRFREFESGITLSSQSKSFLPSPEYTTTSLPSLSSQPSSSFKPSHLSEKPDLRVTIISELRELLDKRKNLNID